ncbi:MAG: hypothetical protein FWF29_07465, partial [Treponema sp.]|nr:hypothetical protein [Treponema sp.]
MKRTILGLVTVLLALGLVLAGCAVPFGNSGARNVANANVFDPSHSFLTMGNDNPDRMWIYIDETPDHSAVYYTAFTAYNFYVVDQTTQESYTSFCGNHGSSDIGLLGKQGALDPDVQAEIVSILNYINNKYGSIDKWSGDQGNNWYDASPEGN